MSEHGGLNKNGACMITYSVEGHKKTVVKYAIRLEAIKVVLLNQEKPSADLLNSFGLITEVRPISTKDISLVVSSILNVISDAKNDHDDISVLLLPSNPIVVIGMYIAACVEKVKIFMPTPDFETEYLTLPFFPFVNLNENERFVLTKIGENGEINKKNLFKIIKKEGRCDMLCSRNSAPTSNEESLLKNLQRILNRLDETGLASKRRGGRYFLWSSTSFGKLVFDQKKLLKTSVQI